jgi:RNA polymerase sigma-70 factor (ECF subfamily)
MHTQEPDTDQLLRQAADGDRHARSDLLQRHRGRLRKMVAWRFDRRLAPREDPSDVVQEVLLQAEQKLDRYLQDRPLPFYPWLRSLAWEHLTVLHRRHLRAKKRSVLREEPGVLNLPDESVAELAATSPTERALRQELRQRVRQSLEAMSERDREVLLLRSLEQRSVEETAAVLGIKPGRSRCGTCGRWRGCGGCSTSCRRRISHE